MSYRVRLTRVASRGLDALPDDDARRVAGALARLGEDPRPPGARKLAGRGAPLWRVRVGALRIIYSVSDRNREVEVTRIAGRGEAYRF